MEILSNRLPFISLIVRLLFIAYLPTVRAVDDSFRARFDALYDAASYREATDLLISYCDKLTDPSGSVSQSEIDDRTKEVGNILPFRSNKLRYKGDEYAKELLKTRDKYMVNVRRACFSAATKPAVRAIITFNLLFGESSQSILLYDLIPEKDRTYFNIDVAVFDELWNQGRIADVAQLSWAKSLIDERLNAKEPAEKTHLGRTKNRHLAVIGRTVAALRTLQKNQEAAELEGQADKAFTAAEVKAAVAAASAALKKGTP